MGFESTRLERRIQQEKELPFIKNLMNKGTLLLNFGVKQVGIRFVKYFESDVSASFTYLLMYTTYSCQSLK